MHPRKLSPIGEAMMSCNYVFSLKHLEAKAVGHVITADVIIVREGLKYPVRRVDFFIVPVRRKHNISSHTGKESLYKQPEPCRLGQAKWKPVLQASHFTCLTDTLADKMIRCILRLKGKDGALLTLQNLKREMQAIVGDTAGGEIPKPCEWFDLFEWTGKGCLLAIMLGPRQMVRR